jgi:hypothetical protein
MHCFHGQDTLQKVIISAIAFICMTMGLESRHHELANSHCDRACNRWSGNILRHPDGCYV